MDASERAECMIKLLDHVRRQGFIESRVYGPATVLIEGRIVSVTDDGRFQWSVSLDVADGECVTHPGHDPAGACDRLMATTSAGDVA